jgi:hydrogenase maturation protease
MSSFENKTLLLGLGSDVMCDAGIGPKLAEEIYERSDQERNDLVTSIVGGLDLLQIITPYKKVIIFDGILAKGSPVGQISVSEYPVIPNSLHLSNAHDADFSALEQMAEISGFPFPDEITIITVSVKDPFTISAEFSDELKGKFNEIMKNVRDILKIPSAS